MPRQGRPGSSSSRISRSRSRRATRRRHDLHVPPESGNPVLRRPLAAGERLPPRDRTAVSDGLTRRRLLPRHHRGRQVPRAARGMSPLPGNRHRRPGAGTVTFHLVAPDPRLSLQAHRLRLLGADPAGARRIATWDPGPSQERAPIASRLRTPGGVELVRNRFFGEWSHAAQPDGNPDRVIWDTEPSRSKAVREVLEGRAAGSRPTAGRRSAETARRGGRASSIRTRFLLIDFTPLNTHRQPFDDIRARQALNYAIDRSQDRADVRRQVGRAADLQTLMPGMLGYRPHCPYTRPSRRPGCADGARPFARAPPGGRLGNPGERVDVWGPTDSLGTPRQLPPYFARVLRAIGYRTKLHMIPASEFTPALRRRIQLSVDGDWLLDYPAPSALLPQFFGCNGGLSNGYVCDPALDRRMRRASLLELRSPARAAQAWASIDREIVRNAYWVPTVRAPRGQSWCPSASTTTSSIRSGGASPTRRGWQRAADGISGPMT